MANYDESVDRVACVSLYCFLLGTHCVTAFACAILLFGWIAFLLLSFFSLGYEIIRTHCILFISFGSTALCRSSLCFFSFSSTCNI